MVSLGLATLTLLLGAVGGGADVKVTTELVATEWEVGVPFEWLIHVEDRLLADVAVAFPDWPAQGDGDVQRRGVSGPAWSRSTEGRQRVTFRVTLVASRAGRLTVPSATVVLEEQGLRIHTDSPTLVVQEPVQEWSVRLTCSTQQVVPEEVFRLSVAVTGPANPGRSNPGRINPGGSNPRSWQFEEWPLPPWQYEVVSERWEGGPTDRTRWQHLELMARPGVLEALAPRPGRLVMKEEVAAATGSGRVLWCAAADLALEPLPPLPTGVLRCQGVGTWRFQAARLADASGILSGVELLLTGPGAERGRLPALEDVRSLPPGRTEVHRDAGRTRQVTWFDTVPEDVPPLICTLYDPAVRDYRVHRVDLPALMRPVLRHDGVAQWVGWCALVLGVLLIGWASLGRSLLRVRRGRNAHRKFRRDQATMGLEQALCEALTQRVGGVAADWRSCSWEDLLSEAGFTEWAAAAGSLQRDLQAQGYGAGRADPGGLVQRSSILLKALG